MKPVKEKLLISYFQNNTPELLVQNLQKNILIFSKIDKASLNIHIALEMIFEKLDSIRIEF